MRWRFVDRILSFEPWTRTAALKACSLEEYNLLERWGQPGLAPGILALESGIQAARWLVEASSGFTDSMDVREISRWRAGEGLRPGERLRMDVAVAGISGSDIRFSVRLTRCGPGEPVQADPGGTEEPELVFTASLVPLQGRDEPGDREALWNELRA